MYVLTYERKQALLGFLRKEFQDTIKAYQWFGELCDDDTGAWEAVTGAATDEDAIDELLKWYHE